MKDKRRKEGWKGEKEGGKGRRDRGRRRKKSLGELWGEITWSVKM